jgi:hypothetical protein
MGRSGYTQSEAAGKAQPCLGSKKRVEGPKRQSIALIAHAKIATVQQVYRCYTAPYSGVAARDYNWTLYKQMGGPVVHGWSRDPGEVQWRFVGANQYVLGIILGKQ